MSNQCAAESPDGFAGARERFETILSWLDGGPSTLLDHGELERQLDIEGRRLLRQLLQDHLDLARRRGQHQILDRHHQRRVTKNPRLSLDVAGPPWRRPARCRGARPGSTPGSPRAAPSFTSFLPRRFWLSSSLIKPVTASTFHMCTKRPGCASSRPPDPFLVIADPRLHDRAPI